MPQTNTWLVETIEALQDLNSESSVKEICLQIKKRNKMNFSSNPKWLSTVSHYIQRNCEGYRLFLGSSDPLFKKIKFGNRVKFSLIEFSSDNVREQVLDYELNGFPEGKEKFIKHLSYERRPLVIAIAKENFKEANDGQIFCEICGFNFEEKYGEHGKGFIEGHHILPVSEMGETHHTTPDEIIMVCSNCHRMLHRKRPWITKDKLKSLLKQKSN